MLKEKIVITVISFFQIFHSLNLFSQNVHNDTATDSSAQFSEISAKPIDSTVVAQIEQEKETYNFSIKPGTFISISNLPSLRESYILSDYIFDEDGNILDLGYKTQRGAELELLSEYIIGGFKRIAKWYFGAKIILVTNEDKNKLLSAFEEDGPELNFIEGKWEISSKEFKGFKISDISPFKENKFQSAGLFVDVNKSPNDNNFIMTGEFSNQEFTPLAFYFQENNDSLQFLGKSNKGRRVTLCGISLKVTATDHSTLIPVLDNDSDTEEDLISNNEKLDKMNTWKIGKKVSDKKVYLSSSITGRSLKKGKRKNLIFYIKEIKPQGKRVNYFYVYADLQANKSFGQLEDMTLITTFEKCDATRNLHHKDEETDIKLFEIIGIQGVKNALGAMSYYVEILNKDRISLEIVHKGGQKGKVIKKKVSAELIAPPRKTEGGLEPQEKFIVEITDGCIIPYQGILKYSIDEVNFRFEYHAGKPSLVVQNRTQETYTLKLGDM